MLLDNGFADGKAEAGALVSVVPSGSNLPKWLGAIINFIVRHSDSLIDDGYCNRRTRLNLDPHFNSRLPGHELFALLRTCINTCFTRLRSAKTDGTKPGSVSTVPALRLSSGPTRMALASMASAEWQDLQIQLQRSAFELEMSRMSEMIWLR